MREVIHRVDAPFVTGLMVLCVTDTIKNRIPHVDVRRGHIDLGPQHQLTVLVLAIPHVAEHLQTLFHRAVPVGAVSARLFQASAVLSHFVGCQGAHIGLVTGNQFLGKFIESIKVIRGITNVPGPLVAKPLHILFDGVDVFLVFLFRVGVVKPQVAVAGKGLGDAKIQADRFGMTNMQVTVGLRRESGDHLAGMLSAGDGVFDQALDKVVGFLRLGAHTISVKRGVNLKPRIILTNPCRTHA